MESSERGTLEWGGEDRKTWGTETEKSGRWSRQLLPVLAHSGPTLRHPCESAGPPLGDEACPSLMNSPRGDKAALSRARETLACQEPSLPFSGTKALREEAVGESGDEQRCHTLPINSASVMSPELTTKDPSSRQTCCLPVVITHLSPTLHHDNWKVIQVTTRVTIC